VNKALPLISGIWRSGMGRLADSSRRHALVRARSRSRHRPALQGGTPPFVPVLTLKLVAFQLSPRSSS
jgi:hypothetical protein